MESKLKALPELWANLTSSQRFMVTFFAAGITVAAVVIAMIASRPDYTVLFANLKPEDAAGIVQKLRDSKVPYRVSANGTAVEVPSRDVYEVRLNLAGDGLPQGGSVGFEIFDRSTLGVTDFTQRMDYIRALQGELQRTISSIDQVSDARVHINIPEDTLYSDKEKDATASVLLNLRSPGDIDQEKVASIVNLVSAAVEGLKPEHVTVVDTRGKLLSEGSGSASSFRLSASQLDLKRGIENEIQRNVETMLEPVVGRDAQGNPKAVVRVNAQLKLDSTETTTESYSKPTGATNDNGFLSVDDTTSEAYGKGAAQVAGGAPGVASNSQPNTQATNQPVQPQKDNGYNRQQYKREYMVDRTTRKSQSLPGEVQSVSVAVMVDSDVPAAKLESIRRTVAATAGITPSNGTVVVESVEFPKQKPAPSPGIAASLGGYLGVGRNALGVILLVGFALFMKGAISRQTITISGGAAQSQAAGEAGALFGGGEFPAAGASGVSAESSFAGFAPETDGGGFATDSSVSSEENGPPHMKRPPEGQGLPVGEAQELAKSNPEEVATIVRTWMAEDRAA